MREEDSDRVSRQTTEAWRRLKKDRNWGDWIKVGEGLRLWRDEAMRAAGTNRPEGKGYNQAFGDRLTKYKLDDMDKGDRSRLFAVMDNLPAIEAWRQGLPLKDRLKLNHPSTVLRNWRAFQAKNDPDADTGKADEAALKEIDNLPKLTPIDEPHDPLAAIRELEAEVARLNAELREARDARVIAVAEHSILRQPVAEVFADIGKATPEAADHAVLFNDVCMSLGDSLRALARVAGSEAVAAIEDRMPDRLFEFWQKRKQRQAAQARELGIGETADDDDDEDDRKP